MNINKKILVFIIAFSITIPVIAQKATLKRANKLFDHLAYYEAIPLYKRVLKTKSANSVALHKIAECYRKLNDNINAEIYFSKVVKLSDVTPIENYYYGMALIENGKNDEAKKWINEYKTLMPSDERSENKLSGIEKMNFFIQDSSNYTISECNFVNSDHSDFGPIYFDKGILFSSNRYTLDKMGNIHGWTGKDFYRVFYFDNVNNPIPIKFSNSFKYRFNDGPISFDKKNKLLYVTRNEFENGKVIKASDDQVKLHIYAYKYNDRKNEWSDEIAFEYNNSEYNMAHPAVSPDGNYLIFSSDIPGGFGGMDLYLCKKEDNNWGQPINMGSSVNTKGDEVFPSLNKENLLIFSSNGLEGMGGLDLYYTSISNDKPGEIKHYGYPVNSQFDDFGMVLNDNSSSAFFSSNRKGGKGDDDIYELIIHNVKPASQIVNLTFTGAVKNKKTLELLDNVKTVITDEKGLINTGSIIINGFFSFKVETKFKDTISLKIMLEKDGYLGGEYKCSFIVDSNKAEINKSFELLMAQLFESNRKGKDIKMKVGESFRLNDIYFAYGSYELTDVSKIILNGFFDFLKAHPTMKVSINGHTDNISGAEFNQTLSENRAKSVYNYLVNKGVDASRLSYKGYGLTKPIASNKTEEGRAKNRRTEFVIIKM